MTTVCILLACLDLYSRLIVRARYRGSTSVTHRGPQSRKGAYAGPLIVGGKRIRQLTKSRVAFQMIIGGGEQRSKDVFRTKDRPFGIPAWKVRSSDDLYTCPNLALTDDIR